MKILSRINLFFIVLIISFGYINCSNPEVKYEEKLLKNTVRKYLLSLMETYRDFYIERLDGICSEGEKRRIDVLIQTMKLENKYLDAKLKELSFIRVLKIDNDNYEVWTEEKWDYLHRDIKTQLPVDKLKSESYKMVYTVVKREGQWIVNYVDFADARAGKRQDIFEEYKKFIKEMEERKRRKK